MGWRVAFAGTGLLGLAAVAGIALHVPDLPPGAKGVSLAEQARLLANPRLLLAFLMTAVGYAGAFATFSYLPAILEKVTGFAPAMVTVLLAMVGLGVTAGNLLGGRVADRGIFGAIAGLYGMVAAGLLALWLGAPYPAAAVLVLIFLSVVIFSPGAGLQMLAVRQARRFAPGAEDVAAGLNQSAFNLGIAAGAFVASRVVRSSLGLAGTPLASIALVLCAIGLTGLAWWLERRPAGKPSGLNYEEVGPKPLPGTAIAPDLLS
jgi:predicted MFS family arabinose efflux permease